MYWKPLWLYSSTAGFSFHCSNRERHWIFFLWHSFIQKAPPVMILIDFKHTLTAVSFLKKSVTSVIVLFVYHYLAHANKKITVNWSWMDQIICTQQSCPLALAQMRNICNCKQKPNHYDTAQSNRRNTQRSWFVIFLLPDEQRGKEGRREIREQEVLD